MKTRASAYFISSEETWAQVKLPLKESSTAVSTAKPYCDEDDSAAVTYYTASVIASPVTVLEPKEEKGIAICPSQKWPSIFSKAQSTKFSISSCREVFRINPALLGQYLAAVAAHKPGELPKNNPKTSLHDGMGNSCRPIDDRRRRNQSLSL